MLDGRDASQPIREPLEQRKAVVADRDVVDVHHHLVEERVDLRTQARQPAEHRDVVARGERSVRIRDRGPHRVAEVALRTLGEAREEMEVQYGGEAMDIGFNATYLLEVLRYIPTDEVAIAFRAPERAATLQPHGGPDGLDYLCLVMPLRLLD